MNNTPDLLYWWFGVSLIFMAASSWMLIHVVDKVDKHKELIQDLRTETKIARDRVSYLYDQVSRVETKVDVQETLEAIQDAIEASQEDPRDAST